MLLLLGAAVLHLIILLLADHIVVADMTIRWGHPDVQYKKGFKHLVKMRVKRSWCVNAFPMAMVQNFV